MVEFESETHSSITAVNQNQWDYLVTQSDLGSVFHQYEWLRAIEDGTDLQPRHVVISKNSNPVALFPNFIAGIPMTPFKRLVSIDPGYGVGVGGPVLTQNKAKLMRKMLEEVDNVCSGSVITHRVSVPSLAHTKFGAVFESNGYESSIERCRMIVDLSGGLEPIQARMSRTTRTRAFSELPDDFEIEMEELNKDNVSVFYSNYERLMERFGTEPCPFRFLDILAKKIEGTHLVTLYVDGENKGSHLLIEDELNDCIRFWFSGVTEEGRKYHSSELLNGYGIRWSIENGYEKYDLGETLADFSNGLFMHKRQFGAEPIPLFYWEKIQSPIQWNMYRTAGKLYRAYNARRE